MIPRISPCQINRLPREPTGNCHPGMGFFGCGFKNIKYREQKKPCMAELSFQACSKF